MVKPDVLVTFPREIDFPVWRFNMQKYRQYFNKVIACFNGLGQPENYEEFIKEAFKDWDFELIDSPVVQSGQDWRDVTVNAMLPRSTSDWVWFMEPDFLWNGKEFLERLFFVEKDTEVRAIIEKRLHPACILVSQRMIGQTSKDFGIRVNESDHFGFFSEQLSKVATFVSLQEMGFREREDYFHMAGLTHNYTLCRLERYHEIYKPQDFLLYNYYARKMPVKQDNRFLTLSMVSEEKIRNLDNFYRFFKP